MAQAGNQAAALQASGLAPVAGYTAAGASARSFFSLQPGSSVTFLGALNLGVSGNQPGLPDSYLTTELFGYATGLLSAGGMSDSREIGNATAAYTPGAYSFGETALLSVTVINDSNTVYTGYLDSAVGIYAVSAVPEPGTYALLLAGVLVVGFVARRRA
ncbi:PEP-CTERM sorting domain-containing protein [Rubrivivax rivuli]|uniref:PEP-CTERM sorting domain-containing protein n=2 Tax=Rubrivivax rivuli TaxID=1862385 RepID=A0A437RFR9_9BURK|nr:PEP-CTERM sorting domain-containing protein [Rubrivivax rivuli]